LAGVEAKQPLPAGSKVIVTAVVHWDALGIGRPAIAVRFEHGESVGEGAGELGEVQEKI
jgi:hypothetical protein